MDMKIREWDPEEDMDFFDHCEFESFKGTIEVIEELTEKEIKDRFEKFLEGEDQVDVTGSDHSVFIAEENGDKVGLLWVSHRKPFWRFDQSLTWVYNLYIEPDYRRKGLGKKLLEMAEKFTREEGLEKIALHVIEWNRSARALYESSGYELIHSHNESRFYEKKI